MTVEILKSKAKGSIFAPPSKSAAHRALICAALSEKSEIKNIGSNDDIKATLSCLQKMGAKVSLTDNGTRIGGLKIEKIKEETELFVNESGSTLRFLIPLCLNGNKITFKGSKRLFERPLDVYADIFKSNGIAFETGEDFACVCGKYPQKTVKIKGNISSQFISGFCFYFAANGGGEIEIIPPFESKPYVDMTLDTLNSFGVLAEYTDNKIVISGDVKNTDMTVEGDCSSAAFLDAFNLLGGDVEVLGLNENTLQGDSIYKRFYSDIKSGVKVFDLSDCPDLAPVMFALSAHIGEFTFTGTKRLALKESDRAKCMKEELEKFGARVEIFDNEVKIYGGNLKTPTSTLCGHNDHRIVMSLAVLCSYYGGKIECANAVSKSYPEFFENIKALGVKINYEA